LNVGGTKCGGCSAAVKRILQSKPEVEAAAVNILTEIAVVKVVPGTETSALLAEDLAKSLTAKVSSSPKLTSPLEAKPQIRSLC
jgi:cation transport ATPase